MCPAIWTSIKAVSPFAVYPQYYLMKSVGFPPGKIIFSPYTLYHANQLPLAHFTEVWHKIRALNATGYH